MNLNEPVDQDATHLPFQVVLMIHVVGIRQSLNLQGLIVLKDLFDVFGTHGRIVKVFGIEIGHSIFELLDNSLYYLNLLSCTRFLLWPIFNIGCGLLFRISQCR